MNTRVITATTSLPDSDMDFIYDTQNGQWDAQDEVDTTHPRYEATEDDLIRAKRDAHTVAPLLVNIVLTEQDTTTTTPEPTHNTVDTRKPTLEDMANTFPENWEQTPLRELGSKNGGYYLYWKTGRENEKDLLMPRAVAHVEVPTFAAEIAHRWNNHNDLLAALKAFADNVSDDEDDYPDYEAYKQAKRLEEQARAAILNATPTT